ncbi:MAG: alkaline phosphatase family protein [Candidatus Lokiarchaeota archaeon]
MRERNVILGIDGIPFKLIDNLSDKGIMPNFKDLKNQYTFLPLKSSIPHISSVSWSSIITGKNPGEHGIYGFMEMIRGTYSLSYPNFNALKAKPFWYRNKAKKSIIYNVPSTYPAKKLNGLHIAGFVALDLEKAVYPREILTKLNSFNYQVDVDTTLAHEQSKELFIKELLRVLEIRKNVYKFLWNQGNWDNFMMVITSSDRIGHFLWDLYENKDAPLHSEFLDFFKAIDNIIGEIVRNLSEEDNLIILSDHGMEPIKKNVNLNTYFQKEGLLDLSEEQKRYNRITERTKAFILDPGRIYLNMEGRFPRGVLNIKEKEEFIELIKDVLYNLEYNGQKVIKKVYDKNEIYYGSEIDRSPDLVCIENTGFRLKGAIGKKKIFDSDIFTGKHNDKAFILTKNNIDIKNPKVEDVIKFLK